MARTHNTTDDYGASTARTNKAHRPLLLANHALHWISSILVLSIAAYFIHHYHHDTHLVYWVALATIDAILYFVTMLLPLMKKYQGHAAPFTWIFSYLWLTAFIFAAQDYSGGRCSHNSPAGVNHCTLKKTLEAFAFLAFLTSMIGTFLEGKLWHSERYAGARTGAYATDKHHAGHVGTAGTTTTTAPQTAVV